MTAAVPDPRFRDQLAEVLREADWGDERHEIVALLMPTIAAEVEARVQAAANQRAAVEGVVRRLDLCHGMTRDRPGEARAYCEAAEWLRAALASPAPAPQDGEARPRWASCTCPDHMRDHR